MSKTTQTSKTAKPAYLVIREGSRWSDVFSLIPGRRTIIGRASSCHIIIRDERCSRQHADLFAKNDQWVVQDNGSRNGTRVDGQAIVQEHVLQPGQILEVAGCHMVFVHDIARAFDSPSEPQDGTAAPQGAADDQQTVEGIDPGWITHRQGKTSFLESEAIASVDPQQPASAATELFQLAFALTRAETSEAAAQSVLDTLLKHTGVSTGAVLRTHPTTDSTNETNITPDDLIVLATRQRPHRSYHRMPDFVAQTVLRDGEAVLARNIGEDSNLASRDSRGQLSTTSTLCAPIRSQKKILGLLHLYSSDDEPSLQPAQLEFALAVAENLGLALENLDRHAQLELRLDSSRKKVALLRQQLGNETQIVGQSPAIEKVIEAIERAGPTSSTVLIRGESGVGKELVAAALHAGSPRNEGPFVCLNCAALSPMLLESELFGHEKGAFTGATDRKIGKFEAADGGTLMLDEIGEMSADVQAKFLRVLEGHAFERVGGNRPIKVDVRVVSATNRDLQEEVRAGRFRADLYFRLHVLEIIVPPLRQRGHDILRLANHYLHRYCQQMGRKIDGFTQAAEKQMLAYDWPGNIRELKNVIERAVVLTNRSAIAPEDLVLSNVGVAGSHSEAEPAIYQELSLAEVERQHILATMQATDGNKSRAATILGIERSTLDRKLKRYEIHQRDWVQ